MKIILPPEDLHEDKFKFNNIVFLAGSIENGKSEDWQTRLVEILQDANISDDVLVANPRRKEWDASWSTSNDSRLIDQIEWELDYLLNSTLIFFNFCSDTLSPVSLLELGITSMQHASQSTLLKRSIIPHKIIVHIEKDYLRKKNILITLHVIRRRYPNINIQVILDDFAYATQQLISAINE